MRGEKGRCGGSRFAIDGGKIIYRHFLLHHFVGLGRLPPSAGGDSLSSMMKDSSLILISELFSFFTLAEPTFDLMGKSMFDWMSNYSDLMDGSS